MTTAVACLRPKRPLGMALWHGSGMQAEGPARPGPEGGRIVNASRIPPTPLHQNGVGHIWTSSYIVDAGCLNLIMIIIVMDIDE